MFKLHKPQLSGSIHSGHFMVSRLDDDDEDDEDDDEQQQQQQPRHHPNDLDSSESERDNANSVEIDVNNPDSMSENNLDIVNYSVSALNQSSAKNSSSASSSSNQARSGNSTVNDSSSSSAATASMSHLNHLSRLNHRLTLINHHTRSADGGEHLTNWNDLDRKHTSSKHRYLTYYTSLASTNNSSSRDQESSSSTSKSKHSPLASQQQHHHQQMQKSQHHQQQQLQQRQLQQQLSAASAALHHQHVTNLFASDHQHDKDLLARGINTQLNQLHQHHQHIQADQTLMDAAAVAAAAVAASSSSTQLIQLQQHQHLQQQLQQLQQQQHLQHYQNHQQQHAVTIDTSLTKLLECMSLYYSSKLTSPKWKSFKGLKLRLKYKIRLNNLIWRAWFLQCIRGRRPPGCQFTAPIETDVHKKSETIVLEGKYWKRKEKAIVDEYKKWRIFHKQKSQMNCFRPVSCFSS